jgi:hypothetical protein
MMDFKELAKQKHATYSKNGETSELFDVVDGPSVFYTKDGIGAVRMHTYTEFGRTIELVDSFPTVVKAEGIVAKAVRKLKGE